MAVKVFLTKPNNLNSVLGMHVVERELAPADHPQTSTRAYTRVNIVKMIIKREETQYGGRKILL